MRRQIEARGRTLIVAQSDAGKLFRIEIDARDPDTRLIAEIALDQPVYADGLHWR